MCKNMETSRWWWFRSHHNGSDRSPWLQSTLSELDNKTKAMLELMEEDGDSFSQRAEKYCKNRPELINLVGDLYRSHRSLAERYDRVKSGNRSRPVTTLGSLFFSINYISDETYDSCYDTLDSEDYAESEVDDPEHKHENEDETLLDGEVTEDVPSEAGVDEAMKLREEIERLKEDKENLKAQLLSKDNEKREVIRQLGFAIELLKDENVEMKKRIMKESTRKWDPLGFRKLKGGLFGMLLHGS